MAENAKKTAAKKLAAKKTTTKKVTKPATKKAPSKKSAPKKATAVKQTQKPTKIVQKENNYQNTIIAAVLIVLIFVVGIIAIKTATGDDNDLTYKPTADEIAFKEAYESLNGTGAKEVEILKDNNIKYISMKEASEILNSKSGVIFFGFAACDYCRNAVPELLEAMKSSELDTIYYVDLRPENKEENDLRDLYSLNNKNKAKIVREATREYEDVRVNLANYLDDYVLYTSKGKKVNTSVKRLYAPTVVSVVNGQILGFHQGTVDKHEADQNGVLPELTKDQRKTLKAAYTEVIKSQLTKKCTIKEGC